MSEPAAIYLRVSTDEQAQDGHVSLDVQRLRCQEYAQRHGMVIVAEYVDVESAYEGRRPQFHQMLQDAEAGRFRHIIVFRADRFSRDVADAFPTLRRLERARVRLHSTLEDLSNWLLSAVTFILAEEESRRISARVRPAKAYRAQQGYYPSKLPFAARRGPGGELVWDPVEGAVMREVYRRLLAGWSLRQLVTWLREAAPSRRWDISYLEDLLRNPLYAGRVRWAGQVYAGRHSPLVDPEEWERAQAVLSARYRHKRPLRSLYAVVGLARCGYCGSRLYICHSKPARPAGAWYHYLACPRARSRIQPDGQRGDCPGATARADLLDAWFRGEMRRLVMDETLVEQIVAALEERQRQERERWERERALLLRRVEELRRRLDRLTEGYLEGVLPREEYLRWQPRLQRELEEAERAAAAVPPPAGPTAQEVREVAMRLPELLSEAPPALVREAASLLVEAIEVRSRSRRRAPQDWRVVWRFGN
jgi:DNA invertase Pin-like site-specific DNA recombinase